MSLERVKVRGGQEGSRERNRWRKATTPESASISARNCLRLVTKSWEAALGWLGFSMLGGLVRSARRSSGAQLYSRPRSGSSRRTWSDTEAWKTQLHFQYSFCIQEITVKAWCKGTLQIFDVGSG